MSERSRDAAVAEVVRRELREGLLFIGPESNGQPPPNDVQAEYQVISSLLEGRVDSADLEARDYYLPLHREVVSAHQALRKTKDEVSAEDVAAYLHDVRECQGPILAELLRLRDGVPYCLRPQDMVRAVHEAARCRRLSFFLRDLDAELRDGRVTADEAIQRLGKVVPKSGVRASPAPVKAVP